MKKNEEKPHGLISKIISTCAENSFLTLVLIAGLLFWGYMSMSRIPLDAIPDLSDPQVIIFSEWPGQNPTLVEDQVTYPITTALLSAPKVKKVRGLSAFGLSFVYVIFEEGTDLYWGRSRVLEYLSAVKEKLPPGVTTQLGPDATGVGWVFGYAVVDETGQHDLSELRSYQDWHLRFALRSVTGVAEVASIGGFVKQYQVQLDPLRLRAYDLSANDAIQAIQESNQDTGGDVVEISGFEYMIRGRGYIRNVKDIESIVVKMSKEDVPIYLRDVAYVNLGPDKQRGITDLDGKGNVVGGIVVMRYGENALKVIEGVKERLKEIEPTLPPGVKIQTWYDRSELVQGAIGTLRKTLIEQMIIVSLVIFFFLLHARSALVPILTIPLGVLFAFIPLYYQGLSANIMSLGGIALAIGAMVDGSIVIIENIHKKLDHWESSDKKKARSQVIIEAMQEVGPALFFALLVMAVAFTPVFTLTGYEGRLFKPLAFTDTYALAFGAILAVTLIPALAVLFIRGKILKEEKNPVNRWLIAVYLRGVKFVLKIPRIVICVAIILVLSVIPIWMLLKKEFMPSLYEGSLLYMPTTRPGISVTEASHILQSMDRQIRDIPEVESVFGKMGRAETATDPAPINMTETTVVLKPKKEWRKGLTWEKLIAEMDEKLKLPGMPNIWWMPIQTRTEMLTTGIRSPIGIIVYGNTIEEIEKKAIEIEKTLLKIPGTRSSYAERLTGAFFLDFTVNREETARYGLKVLDIQEMILTAIGGTNIGQTIEGRERYPINVRYERAFREDPISLEHVFVTTAAGDQIPLSQLAKIQLVRGPDMVRSEGGKLVGYVYVDPGEVPLVNYVETAKEKVAKEVPLAPGMRLEWSGQFKYYETAIQNLKVIIPLTFFIVFVLLYFSTRSFGETGIVLLAIPFSLIGAIWLLFLLNYHLSIAVWVGLISLIGLDAETGVVMLLYLRLAYQKRRQENQLHTVDDLKEAIYEGAANRLRPKLMTVMAASMGLLPLLWSSGIGADVMKRIAAPMVGGLVTSFLLQLFVYPAIYFLWKKKELIRERSSTHAS